MDPFILSIVLIWTSFALMMWRNWAVYDVWMRALRRAHLSALAEIEGGTLAGWERHYYALNRASYVRMLLTVWRRPSSFLPELEAA